MDIFQNCADEICNNQFRSGSGNRSTSITQLAHYFTDMPPIKFSSLLKDDPGYEYVEIERRTDCPSAYDVIINTMEKLKESNPADTDKIDREIETITQSYDPEAVINTSDGDDQTQPIVWFKPNCNQRVSEARRQAKEFADAWERYRQFAAFCQACKDLEEVNITRSLGFFVSSLQFDDTDDTDVIDDTDDLRPTSEYSLMYDSWRQEILEIIRVGPDSTIGKMAWYSRTAYARYMLDKR